MSIEKYKKLFLGVVIFGFLLSILTFSFSYFYTKAIGSKDGVKTESAKLGLALDVKRITKEGSIGLIPIEDNRLQAALEGSDKGSCIDSIGNARCQVYEVKLTNTGNVSSSVFGTIDIKPDNNSKFKNLKWAELRSATDATLFGNIHSFTDNKWKENYVIDSRGSSTFYIMIWISETNEEQNDEDKGSFSGTITFNSTAGVGTTAAFKG